jgi:AP-4 complex subunit mu-1
MSSRKLSESERHLWCQTNCVILNTVLCLFLVLYVNYRTVEINLSLRSEVPPSISAVNVAVQLNIPKFATSLSCDPLGSGERYEYKQQDKHFTWHLKKILGGTSSECKIKVLVSEVTRHVKKEIGSICVDFEIPMYVCSGLQIRFMKVLDRSQLQAPRRWVRYITHSDSYVFRL